MLNALSPLFAYLFSYLRREEGQDFIEYALIIALIVIVGIGTMALLGGRIAELWTAITTRLAF